MTEPENVDDSIGLIRAGRHNGQHNNSNRNQLLEAAHESAKLALEVGDKNQCRRLCTELDRDTTLSLPLRCSIYHLLAQCSGQEKVEYYLDFAASVVASMEESAERSHLREENDALRDALLGELFDASDGEDTVKREAEREGEPEGTEESQPGTKRRRGS